MACDLSQPVKCDIRMESGTRGALSFLLLPPGWNHAIFICCSTCWSKSAKDSDRSILGSTVSSWMKLGDGFTLAITRDRLKFSLAAA